MSALISDQQSGPTVAEFFSPGPGERLRAARLSMGFDLAKIASELHLTSSVVEQLEADQYEGIEARVFVRGYLRNYARIVGMPVDSILRQFDEKWPDDPQQQNMLRESPRLPADGVPSRGWAGAVTWLIVIGFAALFLMWWQGYLDELVPEQIRTAGIGDVAIGTAPGDLSDDEGVETYEPLEPADGSLVLPTLAADKAPAAAAGQPGVADRVETEPQQPAPIPNPPSAPAVGSTVTDSTATVPPQLEPGSASIEATAPDSDDAGRGAESAEQPLSEAGSRGDTGAPVVEATTGIVMTFSAPCWVDVRDSSRKFKLFGEMPKGSRKVLGGEPPYKLVIGNARAVTIEVNGEPFDISRYAKGNVARFTLNP